MEFCCWISEDTYVSYDTVENVFYENEKEAMRVTPAMEYAMLILIEQAETAGLSQSKILAMIGDFVWHGQ